MADKPDHPREELKAARCLLGLFVVTARWVSKDSWVIQFKWGGKPLFCARALADMFEAGITQGRNVSCGQGCALLKSVLTELVTDGSQSRCVGTELLDSGLYSRTF